eukprot:3398060-Amphidinium_carterae.1
MIKTLVDIVRHVADNGCSVGAINLTSTPSLSALPPRGETGAPRSTEESLVSGTSQVLSCSYSLLSAMAADADPCLVAGLVGCLAMALLALLLMLRLARVYRSSHGNGDNSKHSPTMNCDGLCGDKSPMAAAWKRRALAPEGTQGCVRSLRSLCYIAQHGASSTLQVRAFHQVREVLAE